MPERKRYNFKRILEVVVWILVGCGTITLLGAAMYKKNNNYCKSVDITIEGVRNNFFIDKADVNIVLEKMHFGKLKMRPLNAFDLSGMEATLEKNKWIKSAELYFDNNEVLRINISEREPIVRVFTTAGYSFYMDSAIKQLPLSNKFSARLPVFTNFPVNPGAISKEDKALLTDIKNLGTYILLHPFWMAQVEQINITPQRTFELVPKIGNQLIVFGSAENYVGKFNNLLTFYKNVLSKVGWNKYSIVNVSYKDQVVAVKRGAGDIKLDSLKTIGLIKLLVANAQKNANDSSNNIQLVQPRDENFVPPPQAHDENYEGGQASSDTSLSRMAITGSDLITGGGNGTKSALETPPVQRQPAEISFAVMKPGYERPKVLRAKNVVKKTTGSKSVTDHQKKAKAVMQPQNEY